MEVWCSFTQPMGSSHFPVEVDREDFMDLWICDPYSVEEYLEGVLRKAGHICDKVTRYTFKESKVND